MQRPVLRLIAGRPTPVLRHEIRTESRRSAALRAVKEFFDSITSAALAGLAILALVYVVAATILSLGRV